MNKFISKDAPVGRQQRNVKFRSASDDEILKQLNLTSIDEIPVGYVAGWASTPDLDHYSDVVMPGAFSKSIAQKGLTGPKGIKFLVGHDRNKPAGKIHVLEYRGESLWLEGQMNLNISYVRDMYEASKDNGGFSFSVGFYLQDYSFKTDSNDVEFLQIDQGELEEVSVVVFPGNENAVQTFIKEAPEDELFESLAQFEKSLIAAGVVDSRNEAARLTKSIKTNIGLFVPKPKKEEKGVDKDIPDVVYSLVDELKRALE